jgi:hypothetical protein
MRSLLVAVLLLATPGLATAQGTGGGASWIETKTPPSPFIVSLGVGFGRVDGGNNTDGEDLIGASLALDGARRLGPKLALGGHLELALTEDQEYENRHAVLAASARWFLGKSAWLQGGLGVGWYHVQYPSGFEILDAYGPAVHAGAGVVVARAGHFAVGLQGRALYARYDEGGLTTFSLALDLSWY